MTLFADLHSAVLIDLVACICICNIAKIVCVLLFVYDI